MDENERYLNIYPFISPNYCHARYSKIQLQGRWLMDLGFTEGKRISVKPVNENGEYILAIRVIK